MKQPMIEVSRPRVASLFLLLIAILVWHAGRQRVPVPDGPPAVHPGWKVDLRRASSQELELLPGIGPVLANRIITWRVDGGILDGVEDLDHIQGIGPRTISNLRSLVSVAAFSSPGEFKNED